MKTVTYFYRGKVERGNGKPGYDWHNGYSETAADGSVTYPWLTRRECIADAQSQGAKAQFKYPQARQ
jgi:hypothetical protein